MHTILLSHPSLAQSTLFMCYTPVHICSPFNCGVRNISFQGGPSKDVSPPFLYFTNTKGIVGSHKPYILHNSYVWCCHGIVSVSLHQIGRDRSTSTETPHQTVLGSSLNCIRWSNERQSLFLLYLRWSCILNRHHPECSNHIGVSQYLWEIKLSKVLHCKIVPETMGNLLRK